MAFAPIGGPCSAGEDDSHLTYDSSQVLARIGEQTITLSDVDYLLGRSRAEQAAEPRPLGPHLQAGAVALIAWQRQALMTLRSTQQTVSAAEIDDTIRGRAPSEQSEWSIKRIEAAVAQRHGIEASKYRDLVEFRLAWSRYLSLHLTEKNLLKHFERERSRFDGSRFKVDVLAIETPPGQSAARTAAQQLLSQLRTQLDESPVLWQELTAGTPPQPALTVTRDRWVRGSGDLLPAQITPLLALDIGQLSQPIHTAHGVYVLRLLEVEAGDFELNDVRGDVRAHMLLVLLEYLAKQSQARLPLMAAATSM